MVRLAAILFGVGLWLALAFVVAGRLASADIGSGGYAIGAIAGGLASYGLMLAKGR